MTRTSSSSKTTTQPQATPAAPAMPQLAADRAAHRERIRNLPPGTPCVIAPVGRPVLTGMKMANPRYSASEVVLRTRDGEHVRAPWLLVHPSVNVNTLGQPTDAPAAPAAPPTASQAPAAAIGAGDPLATGARDATAGG